MKGLVLTLMFALISYSIHSRNCSIESSTCVNPCSLRIDFTYSDKDAMFMLYPFGYKYSANNSNYNLSGIKMPFVTNSIPERVYLWCACRSMRLSAQLFIWYVNNDLYARRFSVPMPKHRHTGGCCQQ